MRYLVMIALWVMWCAVHSWMTSLSLNRCLKRRFAGYYRFYRLFFNLVALITLAPVILYSQAMKGPALFRWEGYPMLVRLLLLGAAAALFVAGCLKYDMLQFLGLRQIRTGISHPILSASGGMDTSGILRITRHPWYLATIILVWVAEPRIDLTTLIVNALLTVYVIIGTLLEERKLMVELGDTYREYRKNVSMLFPAKWISAKCLAAIGRMGRSDWKKGS